MCFTRIRAALAAVFCLSLLAGPAMSQDVTLTSRDGAVTFNGTLLSFDGEFYRVDTVYGPLTVDAQGVQCDGVGCPDPDAFVARFAISGAANIGNGLMPALIGAFARQRGLEVTREILDDDTSVFVLSRAGDRLEQARITLRASTSAEGFADLIADEADIVLSLRDATAAEIRLARDAGQGDLTLNKQVRVLALDAMVPLVARQNPLSEMSVETLRGIFTGEIGNWADLGGPEGPIQIHFGVHDPSFGEVFSATVLKGKALAPGAMTHGSLAELSDAVAFDPAAIGIGSFASIANAKPVRLRGPCGAVLTADTGTIKAEDYPFDLPLLAYTPGRRLPLMAREFLRFFASPGADVMIRRAGFVDQGIDVTPMGRQGDRLANAVMAAGPEVTLSELQRMVKDLRSARRLSVTFRFRGGSTRLDAQSFGNITRLARALDGGAFDGRQLIFVGFSDGQGGAPANLAISRRRAEAVRTAVRDAAQLTDFGRVTLGVDAYGEAMPVACDDSDWGREANRRVEVWLK